VAAGSQYVASMRGEVTLAHYDARRYGIGSDENYPSEDRSNRDSRSYSRYTVGVNDGYRSCLH